MSHNKETSGEEGSDNFRWGKQLKVVSKYKNLKFYRSFSFNGVEYFLYDSVYLYVDNIVEPSIGKLVKIYESANCQKKVKVIWFFRPGEIRNFLGDYEPQWNEIFLASGEGIGLSNFNPLEAIVGKCNVVCLSKDERNPQASEQELGKADYVFSRSFDVGKRRILEKFADHIDGIKVENFFNQEKGQKLTHSQTINSHTKNLNGNSGVSDKVDGFAVKDGNSGGSSLIVKEAAAIMGAGQISQGKTTMKRTSPICSNESELDRLSSSQDDGNAKRERSSLDSKASGTQPMKKRKLLHDEQDDGTSDRATPKPEDNECVKTVSKSMQDKRKWFKKLPWGERLQKAHDEGKLVSLENLDPSFTSSEVEDLVWDAFNERVEAKMIQCSAFSSPHSGKALVIFSSRISALSAISKLQKGCLMLADGRPIVGSRAILRGSGESDGFVGHFDIGELGKFDKQSKEVVVSCSFDKTKAVSTAHCSQANTVEYHMAIEWIMLREKFDMGWKALHQQQGKEIEDIRGRLKTINTY